MSTSRALRTQASSAIHRPFGDAPAPGRSIEIAPGLLWARMPLPLRLDHVNVWLLSDGSGWTAVECGVDRADNRGAWDALAAGPLAGRDPVSLVATHGHPDHVGLAGWLCERFDVPLHATRASWLWARLTRETAGQPPTDASLRFLARHGIAPETIAGFGKEKSVTGRLVGPQPGSFLRIREGDEVAMGGRAWRVIEAEGHADEHASFWSPEAGVLIAGDQILERITPIIGVFPGEPEADPLSDYLGSLDRFEALPDDALVLPSHGRPFYGLKARIAELRAHHAGRLERTLDGLGAPRTAASLSHHVFERAVAEGQWFLALAETLAHVHRLVTLGEARREQDGQGRILFHRA